MSLEIERKFLVKSNDYRSQAIEKHEIKQGYLNRDIDRVVRLRIFDRNAFITIKGRNFGATRNEWEYEIPFKDANEIMKLCGDNIVSKTRYIVIDNQLRWEIDEFHGRLEGLVVAEIELPSEEFEIKHFPDFVDLEVTDDPRYYNSNLSQSSIPESKSDY